MTSTPVQRELTVREPLPWTTWAGISARITPRVLIAGLITLILVVGEWRYDVLGGYDILLYCLGGTMLVETALSYYMLGRPPHLLSAYISGNSLALLTKPETGLVWPYFVGAFLAIGSKYVLRWRGTHIWNPTNFALSVLLLIAAKEVSILSQQFGNHPFTNLVIWGVGLIVVSRAKILHVTLSYLVAFVVLAGLRSLLVDKPFFAELGPITGPMYQLFIFFMITDPPTVVSTRRGRILVAILIAVFEMGVRMANDAGLALAASFPAMVSLAIVGPIAKIVDLERVARKKRLTA